MVRENEINNKERLRNAEKTIKEFAELVYCARLKVEDVEAVARLMQETMDAYKVKDKN